MGLLSGSQTSCNTYRFRIGGGPITRSNSNASEKSCETVGSYTPLTPES